jgi:membrane protease YdiL (CAAX protease family)
MNFSVYCLAGTFSFAILLLLSAVIWKKFVKSPPRKFVFNHVETVAPPTIDKVSTWWCNPLDWLGMISIVGIFALMGISQATIDGKKLDVVIMTPRNLIASAVIMVIFASIVIAAVWPRIKPSLWLGLRWKKWPWIFLIAPAVVWFVLTSLLLLNLSGYNTWIEKMIGKSSAQDAVKILQGSNDPLVLGLIIFSAVIIAPICEEIIFRGYLYPIAKKFGGTFIGIVFSALVFTGGHGNVAAILPIFLLGAILAFVYEKTGSIWASIAIHFCYNSLTVIILLAARSGLIPDTI